jgi:hypothetical protein
MKSAAECFDKSAEFAERARLAPTEDKQRILYGMAWMWMNLSKHAERSQGPLSLDPISSATPITVEGKPVENVRMEQSPLRGRQRGGRLSER